MTLALYVVVIEVEPSAEEAWNRWHEDVHVPEVLREPGFRSCRKWRDTEAATGGWARYVCHYELTDLDSMRRYAISEAATRLREESLRRFGTVTRYSRQILTEVKRF
jgi:hypothetical protein